MQLRKIMVDVYTIFHANLNFSLIDESEYLNVIENCYWPLLKILEKNGRLKFALELSGNTLSKVKQLDPKLIKALKRFIKKKRFQIIASGWEQVIGPLVPYQVTLNNLRLGQKTYKEILGVQPHIAYVNEQTFSDGLIDLYKEVGYKAIVTDWDNLPHESKQITTPYQPVLLESQTETKFPCIFISSVAMQQFRKVIFGETSENQYMKFLRETVKKDSLKFFPLYGDDLEIYDFKPNSLNFSLEKKGGRNFNSIQNLFSKLIKNKFGFILPDNVLDSVDKDKTIKLTDAEMTIRTKKQEKYNVTRWAVCGRSNSKINTLCFHIFKRLEEAKKIPKNKREKLYKELVSLWASDFRSHTTENKLLDLQKRLGWLLKETESLVATGKKVQGENLNDTPFVKVEKFNTPSVSVKFWLQKGGVIESLVFPKISKKPLCGTLRHGYYQTSKLSADWFTGHTIIRLKDNSTVTDLEPIEFFAPKNIKKYKVKIPIVGRSKIGNGEVVKKYYVYINEPRIDIEKHFMFYSLEPLSFRNFNLTFIPDSFDMNSLYLSTVNGGKHSETFLLKGNSINQDEAVNLKVSSHGCQGATEGWIAIGDKDKSLVVSSELSEYYNVPLVHFEEVDNTFFARISTTIVESDETSNHFFRGKLTFKTTILGRKKPLAPLLL